MWTAIVSLDEREFHPNHFVVLERIKRCRSQNSKNLNVSRSQDKGFAVQNMPNNSVVGTNVSTNVEDSQTSNHICNLDVNSDDLSGLDLEDCLTPSSVHSEDINENLLIDLKDVSAHKLNRDGILKFVEHYESGDENLEMKGPIPSKNRVNQASDSTLDLENNKDSLSKLNQSTKFEEISLEGEKKHVIAENILNTVEYRGTSQTFNHICNPDVNSDDLSELDLEGCLTPSSVHSEDINENSLPITDLTGSSAHKLNCNAKLNSSVVSCGSDDENLDFKKSPASNHFNPADLISDAGQDNSRSHSLNFNDSSDLTHDQYCVVDSSSESPITLLNESDFETVSTSPTKTDVLLSKENNQGPDQIPEDLINDKLPELSKKKQKQ